VVHYSPPSDSTYYYFNGCGNEADIPRSPGLLGAIFPLSETHCNVIRSHSQPVGSPNAKLLSGPNGPSVPCSASAALKAHQPFVVERIEGDFKLMYYPVPKAESHKL
jgi:hypothetical protein